PVHSKCSNGFQSTALFTLGHFQVLWRFTQMSLSGFGALAVGRKVTNPFIYLPIAFLQKYENRLCLAAGDLAKKIETPNVVCILA
ncbi:hypothetical protein QTO17_39935, partial [Vibrio owensii]